MGNLSLLSDFFTDVRCKERGPVAWQLLVLLAWLDSCVLLTPEYSAYSIIIPLLEQF